MAYSKQTFTLNQVLTSTQMNQVETNIADHFHGKDGVGKIGLSYNRQALTGAHTVVAADIGKLLDVTSGTFTIDFDPAATLGAGYSVTIDNNGTGVVTIDPNGSETIDAETTITLVPGAAVIVYSDGTNLHTLPVGGGLQLIDTQNIGAAVAQVDFNNKLNTVFNAYMLDITNLGVATDDAQIRAIVGTGVTPTYQAGTSYRYNAHGYVATTPTAFGASGGDAFFPLTGASTDQGVNSGAATSGFSGKFFMFGPGSAVHAKRCMWHSVWAGNLGTNSEEGFGEWDSATAVTSLRVTTDGGDLDEGVLSLYGIRS